jgi:pimeloyl-ACP methyl ester carboxylesterase
MRDRVARARWRAILCAIRCDTVVAAASSKGARVQWLFLRGLIREKRNWGSFPEIFTRATGDSVFTVDLPGAGTENRERVPLSVPDMVDHVRARWLRDRTGEGPWSLLAVSLGGMIALTWQEKYPQDFQRVVVVNTSSGDLSGPLERFNPRALRVALARNHVEREKRIVDITVNRRDFDIEAHAARAAEIARDRPISFRSGLRQIVAGTRSKLPKKAHVPTLVLASTADRLVKHICSERIAQKLGAELRLHHTGGHDLPFDAPEWIAEQVQDWMKA